ncbi:MAG: KorB domain-containing protein [bacterium]
MDNKKTVQLKYLEKQLDWVNFVTLPQMRKEFDMVGIRELAYDLAINGMVNPQIVALFPEKEFWEYVNYVCAVWKRPLTLKERAVIEQKKQPDGYQVIVAGERRLRAFNVLWNEGCHQCQQEGVVTPGSCWTKHFGSRVITARVPQTKDARVLLSTQLAENVHYRPSTHEEAEAIAMFTVFLKAENKSISNTEIAKRIGRSADMVSRSLEFYSLPESIRALVRDKIIKYGIAIELGRLKDKAQYLEMDLLREANIAVTHKQYTKVEEFHKYVSGLILEYERNQLQQTNALEMMFALASPEQRMRTALNPQTILAVRSLLPFLGKTVTLWEHPENLPFVAGKKLTLGGLLEDYEKVVALLELAIPYIEKAVTVSEAKQLRLDISKLSRIVTRKKQLHEKQL